MSLGPAPFAILSHPWPYKAWLAIANDPDNTLIEDWRELDKFIWQELQLPFADSVFVESHNKNLPGQVNLSDHPELARAHPIDTVHTWGDYMHGGRRGFDREDALRAMDLLAQYNLEPQVWTDHASFQGNLLHNFQGGGIPWTEDRSGHRYENYFYTLDLILELGVHYAWDGTIERSFDRRKATALRPQTFTDGNKLQVFTRYGTWQDADIDGLANLLSETHVQSMLDEGGAYVLYTHLGKRPAQRLNDTRHIPHQRATFSFLMEKLGSDKVASYQDVGLFAADQFCQVGLGAERGMAKKDIVHSRPGFGITQG